MRFGIFIPQGWRLDLVGIDPEQHWGVMDGLARMADANRQWESIWVYDHFHTVPVPTHEVTYEAWSLMSAFAVSTERVRLGQMCTCMGYRNPAYLAKVAATVDIVSGGRVEMGIGAGWYENEWRAYGYGFPPAKERLGALRDGVEIFRQLWTQGVSTHDGRYCSTDGAIGSPRPLQGTVLPGSERNGIPTWVAGGGEKVTLKIAAEYADYTNFGGSLETFVAKSDILREHCATVGRDFGTITRSANFPVVLGSTEKEVAQRLDWHVEHYRRAGIAQDVIDSQLAQLRSAPGVGTTEQVLERLTNFEKAGLGYAICYFTEAAYDISGIQLFENEVLPELHALPRD